jgi:tetratricopeptide (TPR) repeat protein
MLFKAKQLIYIVIIPALLLATACGGQKSKNTNVDADTINAPVDSAITAVADTIKSNSNKSVGSKIAPVLAIPGEAASGIDKGTARNKPGIKNAGKGINQPSFEKLFPVKPNRQQEVTDGLNLAKTGDMPGAIAKFDEAIIKNPKNGEAFFFRAKAEIELKQFDKAMTDLDLAIKLDTRQSLYYYYRGKLYSDSGKQDLAIADFNSAIDLKNDFPDAYNYRGVAKAILQKHKEAIDDYDIGIKGNPAYAIIYYNKGTSQAALKDYQGAIVTFTKGIGLDATQVKAYLNRGNCRLMTNDIDAAIADFDKVISISPQSADAYYNRGYAKYFGKKDGMCDDWRKALSLGHKEAGKMLAENCK